MSDILGTIRKLLILANDAGASESEARTAIGRAKVLMRKHGVTDAEVEARMRGYTGSVTFDDGGRLLAVSCPRGNLVTFWEVRSGRLVHVTAVADGCGVASTRISGTFLVTGGRGEIVLVNAGSGRSSNLVATDKQRWDNHLLVAEATGSDDLL